MSKASAIRRTDAQILLNLIGGKGLSATAPPPRSPNVSAAEPSTAITKPARASILPLNTTARPGLDPYLSVPVSRNARRSSGSPCVSLPAVTLPATKPCHFSFSDADCALPFARLFGVRWKDHRGYGRLRCSGISFYETIPAHPVIRLCLSPYIRQCELRLRFSASLCPIRSCRLWRGPHEPGLGTLR